MMIDGVMGPRGRTAKIRGFAGTASGEPAAGLQCLCALHPRVSTVSLGQSMCHGRTERSGHPRRGGLQADPIDAGGIAC